VETKTDNIKYIKVYFSKKPELEQKNIFDISVLNDKVIIKSVQLKRKRRTFRQLAAINLA